MASGDGRLVPERPLSKSEYAYEALRRQILDGELRPGDRLLLRPLAEQLGLSVMPVRDAIRLLERDGLVRAETHRGATVTPVAVGTVVELIGIRMWLEALAVREAATRHDEASLALVRERLAAAEALLGGDPSAFSGANRALHEAIEAPASSELRGVIAELWDRGAQARRRTSLFVLGPDVRPAAQAAHRAIVAALAARDEDAAVAAMLAHREATLAAWRAVADGHAGT